MAASDDTVTADPSAPLWVPIRRWLPQYQSKWLRKDAVAGVSLWALTVPGSLAYASIAGIPVQNALYSIPLAMVGYAIFGGSRRMVMGTSAGVAALSYSAVEDVPGADAGSEEWVALTAVTTLLVAAFFVIGGLARLGFIAKFFARPVLDGFIIGLGVFIVVGQLPKLVGIPKPDGNTLAVFVETLTDIAEWNWATVAVGVVSLALLFGMDHFMPRVPAAIIVVALAIVLEPILDLTADGVAIVGPVPTGFDLVPYDSVSFDDVLALIPGALAIVVVVFAQTIAIAKSFAAVDNERIDASKEMAAYGATNLGSGLLQGFAIPASLSESSLGRDTGLKSQIAPLFTGFLVLLTILFFASVFENLPQAVLGAVVIKAVWGMLDFGKLAVLWRQAKPEFWAALGALLGVVLIGILAGVLIGIVLSFMFLIHAIDSPRLVKLGRRPDGEEFSEIGGRVEVHPPSGVLVMRFEGPLIFTNADVLAIEMRLLALMAEPRPAAVVVDLEAVSRIDATGSDAIVSLNDALGAEGVRLLVARPNEVTREQLKAFGVLNRLEEDAVFPTVAAAVAELEQPRD